MSLIPEDANGQDLVVSFAVFRSPLPLICFLSAVLSFFTLLSTPCQTNANVVGIYSLKKEPDQHQNPSGVSLWLHRWLSVRAWQISQLSFISFPLSGLLGRIRSPVRWETSLTVFQPHVGPWPWFCRAQNMVSTPAGYWWPKGEDILLSLNNSHHFPWVIYLFWGWYNTGQEEKVILGFLATEEGLDGIFVLLLLQREMGFSSQTMDALSLGLTRESVWAVYALNSQYY